MTQPSTPNLWASLCQLEATGVTTSSSTSLMSGGDEMSRRARAPEGEEDGTSEPVYIQWSHQKSAFATNTTHITVYHLATASLTTEASLAQLMA